MEYQGTVQGEAARLYAGYTYRKPVMARVDVWQFDPERLRVQLFSLKVSGRFDFEIPLADWRLP